MLLEREPLLSALRAGLEQALASQGGMVLLVGEAGIGKTSLIRAFAEQARESARIYTAACEDLSTPEALVLLQDLGLSAWRGAADRSRMALFADALDELGAAPTVVLIEDLHWADEASMDFLRFVGRRLASRPLLVVVTSRDDDAASRSQLRRVANDIPAELRTR